MTKAQLSDLSSEVLNKIKEEGTWLDDLVLNSAQHYIHLSNPELSGFEDTILGAAGFFTTAYSPFVQIIHTGGNHWICASDIFSKQPSEVILYDSLDLVQETSESVKKQLKGISIVNISYN